VREQLPSLTPIITNAFLFYAIARFPICCKDVLIGKQPCAAWTLCFDREAALCCKDLTSCQGSILVLQRAYVFHTKGQPSRSSLCSNGTNSKISPPLKERKHRPTIRRRVLTNNLYAGHPKSLQGRDGTGQHFCSPAHPELTRNCPARLC